MQNSIPNIIQRFKVLALYKDLYKHLKVNKVERVLPVAESSEAERNQTTERQPELHLDILRNEFRQNSVSDGRYCMQKDEMFFLGNAYASYLKSTRDTLALYAKYAKGERSIESTAKIVGLELPKLYQENNNGENK
jgi:hypothetical protein